MVGNSCHSYDVLFRSCLGNSRCRAVNPISKATIYFNVNRMTQGVTSTEPPQVLLWNFHNFKTTVKFPKIPGLNFMEISRKFKGVFSIINSWQTWVSFRKFQEISEVFSKLFSIFHLSKIYGIVKNGLENWSFRECFNVPHNPERC